MKTLKITKHKLIAFLTLILFALAFNGFAQKTDNKEFYRSPYNSRNSGSYGLGQHLLSLGYGITNTLYFNYGVSKGSVYSNYRRASLGPFILKYEFPIREEVGLGIVLEGALKTWRYTNSSRSYKDNAFGTGVAFMGYYHFNKLINIEKMDVYAGAGIGFAYQQLTTDRAYYDYYYNYYGTYYTTQVQSDFNVRPCGVLGIRYYVTPKFAFSAETGYTTFNTLNIGVTFRL